MVLFISPNTSLGVGKDHVFGTNYWVHALTTETDRVRLRATQRAHTTTTSSRPDSGEAASYPDQQTRRDDSG